MAPAITAAVASLNSSAPHTLKVVNHFCLTPVIKSKTEGNDCNKHGDVKCWKVDFIDKLEWGERTQTSASTSATVCRSEKDTRCRKWGWRTFWRKQEATRTGWIFCLQASYCWNPLLNFPFAFICIQSKARVILTVLWYFRSVVVWGRGYTLSNITWQSPEFSCHIATRYLDDRDAVLRFLLCSVLLQRKLRFELRNTKTLCTSMLYGTGFRVPSNRKNNSCFLIRDIITRIWGWWNSISTLQSCRPQWRLVAILCLAANKYKIPVKI